MHTDTHVADWHSLSFSIIMLKIVFRHLNKHETKKAFDNRTNPIQWLKSSFPLFIHSNWCSNAKHVRWVFIFLFHSLFIHSKVHCVLTFDMVSFQFKYVSFDKAFMYFCWIIVVWILWHFPIVIAIVVDVNNADCIDAFKFKFKCRKHLFAFSYIIRLRMYVD